jgi:predicted small lipoprotein YifL
MTRIAHLMPVAVLALVVVTTLVACGGKGGGY